MSRSETRGGDHVRFAEPWEAEVFAMAVHLRDRGLLDWSEWTQALGVDLRKRSDGVDAVEAAPCDYAAWLDALERLAVQRALVSADELDRRAEAWAKAYRSTPHGHPVALGTDHDHGKGLA